MCGKAVFLSTSAAGYQKIFYTFDAIHALLKQRPRADMVNCEVLCD